MPSDIKIIYEDENVLVVDKPAGLTVLEVIGKLIEENPKLAGAGTPPRYGLVHRLDKDTSGILLATKNNETLIFLQKSFKNRKIEKKYICLAEGLMKDDFGEIKTLIARSPRDPKKQTVYLQSQPHPKSAREAVTEYKVLQRFKDYTLLEVKIKTGRKHQIRCHFSYLQHPVAGDKLYGFKNSPKPKGLTRQFLHASYLKIKLPNREIKEFNSELPNELKQVIKNLEPCQNY
jgi:23S rRNA pseudouridine1911/1915/1917 synthase